MEMTREVTMAVCGMTSKRRRVLAVETFQRS